MPRVMVFIDGSNLYHSLRQVYGRTDVDFAKLCLKLAGAGQFVRGYYYNASVDQQRNLNVMQINSGSSTASGEYLGLR